MRSPPIISSAHRKGKECRIALHPLHLPAAHIRRLRAVDGRQRVDVDTDHVRLMGKRVLSIGSILCRSAVSHFRNIRIDPLYAESSLSRTFGIVR